MTPIFMEASAADWIPDFGADESNLFHQLEESSIDSLTSQQIAAALGEDFRQSAVSSDSYTSYPSFQPPLRTNSNTFSRSSMDAGCAPRPKKILTAKSWNSCTTHQNSTLAPDTSSPRILTFGNPDSPINNGANLYENFVGVLKPEEEMEVSIPPAGSKRSYDTMVGQGSKRVNTGSRTTTLSQDHILAERKRREKLSQRFIALSAIIPGLKKVDKASVLGDAIDYLKQLQEKVKTLEDQVVKKTSVETAVRIKKSRLSADDESSSSNEDFDGRPSSTDSLPEIEARMSEKTVLIRIHQDNHKGLLVKALSEIEKLNLTVMSTNVIPFAGSSLDITVMAQIEKDFSMTVKDLVKKLNSAFRQFM